MSFRPALIVVDMQNDFCPPDGSLAVSEGRDIVPLINRLLASRHFILKVATQDWHPADHISFATNHAAPNNKPFESFVDVQNLVANKPEQTMKQRLWPVHCVQGSKGAEIISELDTSAVHFSIKKGQDARVEMYSAFSDSFGNLTSGDGGVSHDLAKELAAENITHVYVVGLAGDYCVKDTALGSAKAGFTTYLVEEAQRCVDPRTWSDVKTALADGSVTVVSMDGDEVRRVVDH
ncbi:NAD(+) salvage pathway protein [Cladophialophora chaetospira]|uniref:nicotinamidase n=1 Tax=Cladophialophora chaetospira TaxID=386627 RepID=A0AA39CQ64_9EURO|nr:NAD(+) salvage pathway protein [Cladophialophora chaetospira]